MRIVLRLAISRNLSGSAFNPDLDCAVAGRTKHHPLAAGVHLRRITRNIGIHVTSEGVNAAPVVHANHDLRIVAYCRWPL